MYAAQRQGKYREASQDIFRGPKGESVLDQGEAPPNVAVKKFMKGDIGTGAEIEMVYGEYRILCEDLKPPDGVKTGIVRLYSLVLAPRAAYLIMEHIRVVGSGLTAHIVQRDPTGGNYCWTWKMRTLFPPVNVVPS